MNNPWPKIKLGQHATFRNGLNFTQQDSGHTVKVVGVSDFWKCNILTDFSTIPTVSLSNAVSNDDLLMDGDLLFVRSNGNKALVGRCMLVFPGTAEVSFSGFSIRGRLNQQELDPYFVGYVFQSDLFRQHLMKEGAGTNISNLNQDMLSRFTIPQPTLSEQRGISELLGAWDDAITKTGRLIAAKTTQRDFIWNELVSWSRWPVCEIGSVICPVSRPEPTPATAYKALGIRSHGKGTFQRTVERPEEIDMETVYAVGPRDLIVNITFAWEGAIALAKPEDEGCFVSHRFPTFEINESKVNRQYLGYAVRTKRFIHQLVIASPGGAGRNRVLKKTSFLKIGIPLPPMKEQNRIADFLNTADREIALIGRQKAALEAQKRGLMQKLLTAQWRVPLRDSGVDEIVECASVEAAQ